MVQFTSLYNSFWSSTASHGVYVDRLLFRFLPLFFDFLKIPAARLSSMRAQVLGRGRFRVIYPGLYFVWSCTFFHSFLF
jgi:hypothetical protein